MSAFEAQQISPDMMQSQNESSISEQLKEIQRQNNHQQFQDLTETSNETANVPQHPPPTGEPLPVDEAPPTGQGPTTSDQSSVLEPDDEPEAPSVDAEVPTNPENVPVPDSEDCCATIAMIPRLLNYKKTKSGMQKFLCARKT